jgi:hypothetical protein
MPVFTKRKWVVLAAIALFLCAVIGYVAYLSWEGYIFPVRYVNYYPGYSIDSTGHNR